jgi:hypothetical protein
MMDNIEDGIDNKDVGGFVVVEVIRDGRDGPKVISRRKSHNLIVTAGKKQLWRLAVGAQTNLFDQMRIGTCGVAAAIGQTGVISPVTVTLTTADDMTLLAGTKTHQWVISYPSGVGSKSATNIQEVVVLNQGTSAAGISCMMRAVFTAVNKTTADKLKITYTAGIV